jgi:hypothetical protein
MKISIKSSVIALSMAIMVMVSASIWYLHIIYNESLEFKPLSIEYFLLVPTEITIDALSRFGSVDLYHFSAADGPKPEITSVKLLLNEGKIESIRQLRDYFINMGFHETNGNAFQKESIEISITIEEECRINCEAMVSMMQHL